MGDGDIFVRVTLLCLGNPLDVFSAEVSITESKGPVFRRLTHRATLLPSEVVHAAAIDLWRCQFSPQPHQYRLVLALKNCNSIDASGLLLNLYVFNP